MDERKTNFKIPIIKIPLISEFKTETQNFDALSTCTSRLSSSLTSYSPTSQVDYEKVPQMDPKGRLENRLCDQAITNILSLTDLVNKVTEQQKDSHSIMAEEKTTGDLIQAKLDDLKSKNYKLSREIGWMSQKDILLEETIQYRENDIEDLKKELDDCVVLKRDVTHKYEKHLKSSNCEEEMLKDYMRKMTQYQENFEQLEENKAIFSKNKNLKEQLQELQEKHSELVEQEKVSQTPEYQEKIKRDEEERVQLQEKIDNIEQHIKQHHTEIEKVRQQQAKVKQECDVLQKRNCARLKRLRKQVEEAKIRNSYWSLEVTRVEKEIERCKSRKKLKGSGDGHIISEITQLDDFDYDEEIKIDRQ